MVHMLRKNFPLEKEIPILETIPSSFSGSKGVKSWPKWPRFCPAFPMGVAVEVAPECSMGLGCWDGVGKYTPLTSIF